MTNPNDNVPTTTSVLSVAEAEDAALAKSTAAPRSQARIVWGRFLRHRAATISAVILIFLTLLSFTSVGFFGIPGWWPHDYRAAGDVVNGGAPTLSLIPEWLGGDGIRIGEHPFGQENTGKDFFALTMMGTQRSILLGLVLGISSTVIGSVIGAVAGYYRGWVDSVLMRITDLFIVIPLLALAAVVGQIAGNIGKNPIVLAFMLSLLTWTGLARLVRGEVLSLRERDFVLAARASGAGGARIIFRHLMPNVVGVIAVNATFAIAGAILLESSLSYLGFGVVPPETSLGLLISQYQGSFTSRPWLFWWPGMMILAIALSINFLGDGIRDAYDPRQSRSVRREIKRRNRA